eukprot:6483614-Prymnesium_polylepis.1
MRARVSRNGGVRSHERRTSHASEVRRPSAITNMRASKPSLTAHRLDAFLALRGTSIYHSSPQPACRDAGPPTACALHDCGRAHTPTHTHTPSLRVCACNRRQTTYQC